MTTLTEAAEAVVSEIEALRMERDALAADLAQLRIDSAASAESSLAVIEAQGQEVVRLQLEVSAGEEALLAERRLREAAEAGAARLREALEMFVSGHESGAALPLSMLLPMARAALADDAGRALRDELAGLRATEADVRRVLNGDHDYPLKETAALVLVEMEALSRARKLTDALKDERDAAEARALAAEAQVMVMKSADAPLREAYRIIVDRQSLTKQRLDDVCSALMHARHALSSPAPSVVRLADVQSLVEALEGLTMWLSTNCEALTIRNDGSVNALAAWDALEVAHNQGAKQLSLWKQKQGGGQ